MHEFEFIERFLSKITKNNKEALNLSADVAMVNFPKGYKTLITTDTLCEGVHFFKGDPPESIAHKLINVNLSDLASSNAKPYVFIFNFSPKSINELSEDFVTRFCNKLLELQNKYNFKLIGGDTSNTNSTMVLSITAIGLQKNKITTPFKFNAKEGDYLYVSGSIGDSYLGYKLVSYQKGLSPKPEFFDYLNKEEKDYLINKYFFPNAKVNLGLKLCNLINAATDVSDGFILDLESILEESNKSVSINLDNSIFSAVALKVIENNPSIIEKMLTHGDDFELIFTFSQKKDKKIQKMAVESKEKITKLGILQKSSAKSILDVTYLGKKLNFTSKGYSH